MDSKIWHLIELDANPNDPALECSNFFNELWVCYVREQYVEYNRYERVLSMEPDNPVEAFGCENTQAWHLDYITKTRHPPNGQYQYAIDQRQQIDTAVYVIDSWMDIDHPEFGGRASRGPAFNTGKSSHATHVGALIAGQHYGVNRKARLISVQALDTNDRGMWSDIVRAMEWVSQQPNPTVINMSIGGGFSAIVQKAVELLVRKGWVVVAAAGNDSKDACQSSPGSSPFAITVGASDPEDEFAPFSNHGRCVDILAPGVDITSAIPGGYYGIWSGTSMAAPIVAGVLSTRPGWTLKELRAYGLPGRVRGAPQATTATFLFQPNSEQCGFFRFP